MEKEDIDLYLVKQEEVLQKAVYESMNKYHSGANVMVYMRIFMQKEKKFISKWSICAEGSFFSLKRSLTNKTYTD